MVEQHALPKEYETMAQSGALFGALRWLATIQHQCTRLASMTTAGPQDSPVMSVDGRRYAKEQISLANHQDLTKEEGWLRKRYTVELADSVSLMQTLSS